MIADDAHGFTETLEVNDLTGTQEADRICNIGIFYHTKNIIIGGAGFCSAAMSSYGSAMVSPVDWKVSAENGVPEAACG